MAKIKINELTQQTPTLNDTIVASGEDKEYACKVDSLKTLIGRKEIYQDFTDHVTFAAGEREAIGTFRIKELVSYCFEEGKIPIFIDAVSTNTNAFETLSTTNVAGEVMYEGSSYRYGMVALDGVNPKIGISLPAESQYLTYILEAASESFELDVTIRCYDFLAYNYLETYEVYLFEDDSTWKASRSFSDTLNAWNKGVDVYFNYWYDGTPYRLRATLYPDQYNFKALYLIGWNGYVTTFDQNNGVAPHIITQAA